MSPFCDRKFRLVFGCFLLTIVCGAPRRLFSEEKKALEITGRALFERKWEFKDVLCPQGDGLGPCFNAQSCTECHNQRGVGGGGDNEHNIDLLTLKSSRVDLRRAVNSRVQLHPDFLQHKSTIVLHKFGTWSDYEPYRFGMLGIEYSREMTAAKRAQFWASIAKDERNTAAVEPIQVHGLRLQLSQRSTPALFGAGLIDLISREEIESVAKEQKESAGEVSGRVAKANGGQIDPFSDRNCKAGQFDFVGRFGWRGQTATLADFVLGACANELGLSNPVHVQPVNPVNAADRPREPDLDENLSKMLIQFVRQLPRPTQISPHEPKAAQNIARGESLFKAIGCSTCHRPKMGDIDGLYSDLLLHDLGKGLKDPVPEIQDRPAAVSFGYVGGSGDLLAEPAPDSQEWRTPPLWGVADSAPYLHDGRAKNLDQAILMHDGEAFGARERFTSLTGGERESVIHFLLTLRAPRQ